MKNEFEGKIILVVGGCGSIGSEIVEQLLNFNPEVIRILDNNEEGHFRLNQRLNLQDPEKIRNLLGSITDSERVARAMENVDIVFHAAALKHVNFCEYNPFEAVKVNVIGTQNLVDAAIKKKVKTFIAISTDKAVNPINTMGATKLLAEKIVTNAPIGRSSVKFCCVRFGNVLNSSGSVIPIFKRQIEIGNKITITSKDMIRFFMSIQQAVKLVLKAATICEGGETFVLKMKALKIMDLAEVLVEELAPQYGKNSKMFKYEIVGLRPGEKKVEYLLTGEECSFTSETDDIFIIKNSLLSKYNRSSSIQPSNISGDSQNIMDNIISKEEIRKILKAEKII
jgi:FlaA1/EpsC-like NDP-sugar epimerase